MSQQSDHRVWLFLALVVIFGAVLRFQAISTTVVDAPIRADARIYYFAALNIDRWGIFSRAEPGEFPPEPDAFVQPGLPALIAPLVEFPPTERMLLRINTVQVILGSVTILFTFALFKLFAAPAIALGAALLTAISPHLVVMTTYLLTETLFTFLLMGGMLFFAYALKWERPWLVERPWLALIGGLLLGLTALTRATTEYLPLLMLPVLYWATDRSTFMRVVLPAAFAALTVIVAWKVRNLGAIGMLSDPSLMVSTFHHGMYPDFMFNDIPASKGIPYRFDPFTRQINGLGTVLSEIQHRVGEDPLRYLYWYLVGKPIALLSWGIIGGIGDIFVYPINASPYFDHSLFKATRVIALVLHTPLTIAAIVGSLITLFKPALLGLNKATWVPAVLIVLLIAYFFALHLLGAPYPRYGIPLRPIVYGFGLFTSVALVTRIMTTSGFVRHQ